jgi:hypothetical protein
MRTIVRRTVLGLLGIFTLVGPVFAQGAAPFAAARLAGVRVDVQPLIAQGNGLQAEALRSDLLAALKDDFADRLGGRGPVLVVRIKGLSMNPYVGGGGGRHGFGGGSQSDYLDGEALLIGARGEVLARHPQLSALPASSGGAWYDPESERRRVTAIAEHYAGWLRRALPAD